MSRRYKTRPRSRLEKTIHPKISEYEIQKGFFTEAAIHAKQDPRWALPFAIPNGAYLGGGARSWRKLAASGCVPGVPDVFIPLSNGCYHGLFLEFKTLTGKLSEAQWNWHEKLSKAGYLVLVPRTIEQAISFTKAYFALADQKLSLPTDETAALRLVLSPD